MNEVQSLISRVGALEKEIKGLRSQTEALTPNYLTIDPTTGQTGADFTGHVHAEGLDLDQGTLNTPPDTDEIRWLRVSDKGVGARLFSTEVLNRDILNLLSIGLAAGNASRASVGAQSSGGSKLSFLTLNAAPESGGTSALSATVDAITQGIIDGSGNSDFVQVPSASRPTQLAIDGAVTSIVFPTSTVATPKVVNHGLGRVPKSVSVSMNAGNQLSTFTFQVDTLTTTQFTLHGFCSVSANATVNVFWTAFG